MPFPTFSLIHTFLLFLSFLTFVSLFFFKCLLLSFVPSLALSFSPPLSQILPLTFLVVLLNFGSSLALPTDLALRWDPELSDVAASFAANETAWLEAFAQGWGELMVLGFAPQGPCISVVASSRLVRGASGSAAQASLQASSQTLPGNGNAPPQPRTSTGFGGSLWLQILALGGLFWALLVGCERAVHCWIRALSPCTLAARLERSRRSHEHCVVSYGTVGSPRTPQRGPCAQPFEVQPLIFRTSCEGEALL